MNFEMRKANMLAENINSFIDFVKKMYENRNGYSVNKEKLYQIILLLEEFRFQVIADGLLRVNRFDWDEKYTYFLVDSFNEGISIINEYVNNNADELFLLKARIHTLRSNSALFNIDEKDMINVYRI